MNFNMDEVVSEKLSHISWLLGNDSDSNASGSVSFSVFQYALNDIWRWEFCCGNLDLPTPTSELIWVKLTTNLEILAFIYFWWIIRENLEE